MLDDSLNTTIYFYLHISVVVLGIFIPFFLPKKYIVYMLGFVSIIVLHWIVLDGECVLSYLDRINLNRREHSIKDAFFYKIFRKYFDVKITHFQSQIIPLFIIVWQIVIYGYRLYI